MAMPLFVSFLIFGLLSIGTTRNRSLAVREYLPGYKTLGMLAAFTVPAMLIGIGLATLFMPYLNHAADAGYQALVAVARPVGGILTDLLRSLFSHNRVALDGPSPGQQTSSTATEMMATQSGAIAVFLEYAFFIIIGLALIVGVIYLAWLLIKWLLSRTAVQEKRSQGVNWAYLLLLLKQIILGLFSAFRSLADLRGRHRIKSGGYWYRCLIKWGRRSGIAHLAAETPREFAERVKHRFPMLNNEVDTIVALFNLETYAGVVLDRASVSVATAAWRHMSSPRHWGRRLYGYILRV